MNDEVIGILISLVLFVLLFLALRGFNTWYWKINESISIAHKTNFLLEKISIQLGATETDEITVEEIATGKRSKVKIDKWIAHKIKNPKSTSFRTVKDDLNPEKP